MLLSSLKVTPALVSVLIVNTGLELGTLLPTFTV